MSSGKRLASALVGVVLFGIYSWIMTTGSGRPGNWAWVILVAAIVAFVMAGRSADARRGEDDHQR